MQLPLETHQLQIFFRGLEDPIYFEVTKKVASEIVWSLTTGDDGTLNEDVNEVRYLRFELVNGDIVLLFAFSVVLVRHLFDFGYAPDEPPSPRYFGQVVTEEDEERRQWCAPDMAIGIDGRYVEFVSGLTQKETGMLGDAVMEGFAISNFMDVDGEINVVNTERLLFVVMQNHLLPKLDPVRSVL